MGKMFKIAGFLFLVALLAGCESDGSDKKISDGDSFVEGTDADQKEEGDKDDPSTEKDKDDQGDDSDLNDTCNPNPCREAHRTVCTLSSENKAVCSCDDGFHEDGEACVSDKQEVECTDNAPENAASVVETVEIKWENGKWSDPADCEWNCDSGFHSEDESACVSDKKEVECTDNPPANGKSIKTKVPVTWENGAWSTASDCAWNCEEGFHTEDNSKCISNSAEIACKNVAPDHAVSIPGNVPVTWENGKWSDPADCKWVCTGGYHTEDDEICHSDTKQVDCTDNPPKNGKSIASKVPVKWVNDDWTTASDCDWECKEGFHTEDQASCIENTKTVNCADSDTPKAAEAVVVQETVTWNGSWSKPSKCAWNCVAEAVDNGNGGCVMIGDDFDHPMAVITETGTFNGDTSIRHFRDFFGTKNSDCKYSFTPGTRDIVYQLDIITDSHVTAKVTGEGYEAVLSIVDSTDDHTELACDNGNGGTDSNNNVASLVKKDLEPGTYFIVVDGARFTSEGSYTLEVTVHDPCEGDNPCTEANRSVCTNENGQAVCLCDEGFHLGSAGTCVSDNPCEPNPCEEPGKTSCSIDGDNYECSCDAGLFENGEGKCVATGGTCGGEMTEIKSSVTIEGDTSLDGIDEDNGADCGMIYKNNSLRYKLVLEKRSEVAVDTTNSNFSTKIFIRKECADDSAASQIVCEPHEEKITQKLEAGTYYLFIGANDTRFTTGKFTMIVTITDLPDPCSEANACTEENRSVCTDLDFDGTAECACDEGYYEAIDGNCYEKTACEPNPCTEGKKTVCSTSGDSYACSCEEGFGENSEGKCVTLGSTCSGPMVEITESGTFQGDNSPSVMGGSSPSCGKTTLFGGDAYRYKVTVTKRTNAVFEVADAGFTPRIFMRKVCDTSAADNELACSITGDDDSQARIETKLEAGTYFLFVNANEGTDGTFTLKATLEDVDDPCNPVNKCTEPHKTVCTDDNWDNVPECACDEGYHDENGTCVEDTACNPNPCADNNDKKTVCREEEGAPVCLCEAGYFENSAGDCKPIGSSCDGTMEDIKSSGIVEGSTSPYGFGYESATCGQKDSNKAAIYKIVVSERSKAVFEVLESSYSSKLFIRETCAKDGVQLACDYSGGAAGKGKVEANLDPGTYFLYVSGNGWSSGSGSYKIKSDITSVADPCLPSNPCTDANKTVCSDIDFDGNAECACEEGFHDESGSCAADTKSVDCIDSSPDNATADVVPVDINWIEGEKKWSETAECSWTCDGGYVQIGEVCEVVTVCNNPNPCTDANKTLCVVGEGDAYTCQCSLGYEDDGSGNCKATEFGRDNCSDTLPAITASMHFEGDTTDFVNDYYKGTSKGKGNDVVYKISLAKASTVKISVDADYDLVIFHGTTCGSTENDKDGVRNPEVVEVDLEAGDYFFIVDGYSSTNIGPYVVDITITEK